ncbi:MAG: hypothetical protein JKX85_11395 [Phycisphaeraceae bacterium]|nr:hypothetical protein [Phycisphaeraceae bacterium]
MMKILPVILIALSLGSTSVHAQAPTPEPDKPKRTTLKGLVINHENQSVDIQAKVVLRDGDWLELLLCTPGTKEHESILTTTAKPSHIHLALIMLGLKPGNPMTGKKIGNELKITEAKGPLVAIDLIYEHQGLKHHVHANQWIYNKTTQASLKDHYWLFTGSSFLKNQDPPIYRADANGSVITLVHFGDDLLARHTQLTSRNDNADWQAQTKKIPPIGTPVTVRLTPIKSLPKKTQPKTP